MKPQGKVACAVVVALLAAACASSGKTVHSGNQPRSAVSGATMEFPVHLGEMDLNNQEVVSTKLTSLPEGWYSIGLFIEGLNPGLDDIKAFFGQARVDMTVTTSLGARIIDAELNWVGACERELKGPTTKGTYICPFPDIWTDDNGLVDLKELGGKWTFRPADWEHLSCSSTTFFYAKPCLSYRVRCHAAISAKSLESRRCVILLNREKASFWRTLHEEQPNG
jgi:hypothetical protein